MVSFYQQIHTRLTGVYLTIAKNLTGINDSLSQAQQLVEASHGRCRLQVHASLGKAVCCNLSCYWPALHAQSVRNDVCVISCISGIKMCINACETVLFIPA